MRTVISAAALVAALVAAISLPVWAAPTTADQAAKAVRGWLTLGARPLGTALGSASGNVETFADGQGRPLYYIVHTQPRGFVIVPADDLVEPIIGFVPGGSYDPSDGNPLGALVSRDMACRVAAARQGKPAAPAAPTSGPAGDPKTKWQRFQGLVASMASAPTQAASIADVRVDPLIQSTWSQEVAGDIPGAPACYNYYTPLGPNGSTSNYPCGCVATAIAQLMRFYQYPTVGIGRKSYPYFIQGAAQTGYTLGGDGVGGAYNWSLMPLSPDANTPLDQCQQIGALCWDVGIIVGMDYAPGGSGAMISSSTIKNEFGYANAILGMNGYNEIGSPLTGMIDPGLDAGYPSLLGIANSLEGHAIVADGYGYDSGTLYHHLNLGWSGWDTAWYNLPTIDATGITFTVVNACVYNVFVTGTGEIISGRITDAGGSPIAGVTVIAQTTGADVYVATTNSKGIYALCPVPSSTTFVLTASGAGYGFTNQPATTGMSYDGGSTAGNCGGVNFTGEPAVVALSVTPSTDLTSTGLQGGPFSSSSVTYTLQNTGTGSLTWTAGKGQTWVTLSKTSGTLGTGATDTVIVSINNSATSLGVGSHNDTVTFTNTTNGNGNTTRAVNLTVSPPSTLMVTSGTGLSSSGFQGGPFSPASVVYTLQNTGTGSLTWTAAKGQTWVTLSKTGGTLSAGATDTVTVSVNNNASSLAVGGYNDTVTFTNTGNSNDYSTRAVSLTVSAAPALTVTPGTDLTSFGLQGGTFNQASVAYTLQNSGGGSLNWTAANGQTWVTLSKASGTLSAGATDTVMVSVNNSANSLVVGGYGDAVTFTNTTNGKGNATRAVSLTVSQPPTMTVTPGTGLTSTGLQGGPFAPMSVVYTVQNSGTGSLSWTAAKGQPWVTLSKFTGTLSAGATDTVMVSINYNAESLGVGKYNDVVTFTNATNGKGNTTCPMGLTVTPIPVKPVIAAIPNASVQAPNAYVGPTPSLPPEALPVTWSLQAGPKDMTIDSGTGVVTWSTSSTTESPCTISIKATNGVGSGTQTWCLAVKSSITYTLAVQTNSGAQASIHVTDPNGQTMPAVTDYSETYGAGSFVTITAPQTSDGANFVKWMLDGSQYSTGTTVTVQMDGTHTLEAVYEASSPQSISPKCGAAGSENLPILGMVYALGLMLTRRFVGTRR